MDKLGEIEIRVKGSNGRIELESDFNTLVDYIPVYDENYLNGLINKAKDTWKGIDEDKWLKELRGGYES